MPDPIWHSKFRLVTYRFRGPSVVVDDFAGPIFEDPVVMVLILTFFSSVPEAYADVIHIRIVY